MFGSPANIKAGRGEFARFQGRNQVTIIDHITTCGIHDDRAIGQLGDEVGIDHAAGFRGRRAMQRQKITMGQQAINAVVIGRTEFLISGQAAAIVIMDFHIKAARTFGNGLTDAAHTDNAKTFAGNLGAHQMGRTPA